MSFLLRQSGRARLEIISTGYMVIDGGAPTTVSYISNALRFPQIKMKSHYVPPWQAKCWV
ncbi:MAG: hypothetical protein WDM78_22665 [Puia sp.]